MRLGKKIKIKSDREKDGQNRQDEQDGQRKKKERQTSLVRKEGEIEQVLTKHFYMNVSMSHTSKKNPVT